jgi:hypothetical protein
VDVQIHFFLTSALVGGEWSASCPSRFTPEERAPGIHWMGGWVDLWAGLDDVKKRKFLTLPGLELPPLGRPARSQSLYRLSSPGSQFSWWGMDILFSASQAKYDLYSFRMFGKRNMQADGMRHVHFIHSIAERRKYTKVGGSIWNLCVVMFAYKCLNEIWSYNRRWLIFTYCFRCLLIRCVAIDILLLRTFASAGICLRVVA